MLSRPTASAKPNVTPNLILDKKNTPAKIDDKKSSAPAANPLTATLMIVKGLDGNDEAVKNRILLSTSTQVDQTKQYLAKLISNTNEKEVVIYPVKFDARIKDKGIAMPTHMRNRLNYTGPNSTPPQQVDPVELITIKPEPYKCHTLKIQINELFTHGSLKFIEHLDLESLDHAIKTHLADHPLTLSQKLLLRYPTRENAFFSFSVLAINGFSSDAERSSQSYSIDNNTQIIYTIANNVKDKIAFPSEDNTKIPLDFVEDGIGGHKNELKRLLREGFFTRALGAEYADAYGVSHTKGILLYGPPGTGKTLIARVIAKKFKNSNIKIVSGPELKNKFVGSSQEKLRAVFHDATKDWKEKREQSPLHVIIFDEIDALAPKRGTHSGGTAVEDDMTTTLLTQMDGVDSPGNILVMGTTNRKELLDDALLRPGRMELHLRIAIPDAAGRLEILNIKTKKQRENGVIDDDVDFKHWAKATENFTGAELEQLVKKATQFAAGGNLDASENALVLKKDIKGIRFLKKVNQEHFHRAFLEITPALGVDKNNFQFNQEKFVLYNKDYETHIQDYQSGVKLLLSNPDLNRLQILIAGASGVGKTELAKSFAVISGAKFIKVIAPEHLLSLSFAEQSNYLDKVFSDARLSESSVIILDELENLLQADINLRDCINPLRLKFQSLLKSQPEFKNKCIVIATTKSEKFVKDMGLLNSFQESIVLKNVMLRYASEVDVEALEKFSELLGFKMTRKSQFSVEDTRIINLPIAELLYNIKKFSTNDNPTKEFNLDQFHTFLTTAPHPTADVKHTAEYKKLALTKALLFGAPKITLSSQLTAASADIKPST